MADWERPGNFYLGKVYDPAAGKVQEERILYDARNLTTHAVCVGMTGSGKTGLCVCLLEEAALNGVPSIIIDPKGDVTNLCLTFPELRPQDFEPWVNVDDARRKGLSIPDYAVQVARTWTNGLAQWDEGPERIRRLRNAADFAIYTPGSDAGLPVSILDTLRAPDLDWDDEADTLREKILSTVSALLGLVRISADPLNSREHILLSNLFERAWRRGEDLDIATLIQQIQKPPIRKLGVFDVDAFFPEKERFALALAFNSILAAPSFETWVKGQPLDIGQLLYTPEGKPRASIFYIAHLDDAQRMFFVTLLLEQVISWMRAQSGTTSLRALVYLDETFGYFPPYPANPPSKTPLMTLMKQARAFGVGMVLTTQNPVDLDYKGLTNAGTWFIGKLQTDRDKARVLEGLEGAIQESGTSMDRRMYDRLISALESRVFILHSVHEPGPKVFMTRWAMSYLRGPLTRKQVRELMAEKQAAVAAKQPTAVTGLARQAEAAPEGFSSAPPQVDPAVPQYYLPVELSVDEVLSQGQRRDRVSVRVAGGSVGEAQLLYLPALLGEATVFYEDARRDVYHSQRCFYLAELAEEAAAVRWDDAELPSGIGDLDREPRRGALFGELPVGLGQAQRVKALERELAEYIYREKYLRLEANPQLKLYARAGESAEAFRERCKKEAARLRDERADKIKAAYEPKIERLKDRLRAEERELAEDQAEHRARKRDEALGIGESVLRVVLGRRPTSALSSASRKRRMTERAAEDVRESEETIAKLQQDIKELQQEMLDAIADLDREIEQIAEAREEYLIKPRRTDVRVDRFGIAWVPYWQITEIDSRGIERKRLLPAFQREKA